eukprot:TRINITY_DN34121_c0_g1_i1.p1 TRINITY_DN34121_c0_g1~~TRINITY_DN34121_c0_g1_i1.p1  ORF type:complete len:160 (+),score=41.55 TRINITY_DN34121_c0_g1_i1:29-481(+)
MLDQKWIKRTIDHRSPFLLIDQVIENKIGKTVVARGKYDPMAGIHLGLNSWALEGCGQAGCVLVRQLEQFQHLVPVFAGMDDIIFHGMERDASNELHDIAHTGALDLIYTVHLKSVKSNKIGFLDCVAELENGKGIVTSGVLRFGFLRGK